ncbi:MAG: hypothetical protein WBB45_18565, partial [Cyclobacteriaceae bacterium]
TTTEQERLGQAVSDNLARLMYHNLDHLIEVNRNKLKESGEEDEQMEILSVHAELKRKQAEFAQRLGRVVNRII